MTDIISNTDDIIDSRDVIARIETLESEIEDLRDNLSDVGDNARHHLESAIQEAEAELQQLKALAEEASGSPDWAYGESLIRHSYFTEYTKELIADCYELPKALTSGDWPWRHMKIDYEAAAREAQQDYTPVEFGGVAYWIRA